MLEKKFLDTISDLFECHGGARKKSNIYPCFIQKNPDRMHMVLCTRCTTIYNWLGFPLSNYLVFRIFSLLYIIIMVYIFHSVLRTPLYSCYYLLSSAPFSSQTTIDLPIVVMTHMSKNRNKRKMRTKSIKYNKYILLP